ncbi:prephenate dehydratase [Saccharicrinis fermentans]|uniref:prephenate dehydratase n=1 Tax=Saccharicrinis fermentans DSM 9555 = JCM 21142 TaxID=869213 RepID=W7Y4G0_9BACT|nr:prephenate dehydratase [Saccharicrinis fermentans]GAF02987.1 P-protein [Saccharicrinis fermentans DSM 9555 = JCM 21142]
MKKVAIQGGGGSNHEIAAKAYFETDNIATVECNSFEELFSTLKEDHSIYGIIAIENTLVGSILQNYTLLKDSGMVIIGEYKLRIKHQLLALPGERLEDIREVHSHPMALAQCSDFFKQYPHIKMISRDDTALSGKWIRDNQLKGMAAIAPALAAEKYNLDIIAKDIETNKRNFTRFLIISHKEKIALEDILTQQPINKSSLVFALPHAEGSLSKVLSILAFYNINLSKIQSLPVVGSEWEYLFYIDLVFEDYKRYQQSLNAIRPLTRNLKSLGEYHVGKRSFDTVSNDNKPLSEQKTF